MAYSQLSYDELRVLRAIGTRTLSEHAFSGGRDISNLRALVAAGLVRLYERDRQIGAALTDRGREWLSVYGIKG